MPKRRGNNEGTYIQRPDGRWEARVSLGYENGKRKRASFYGKTKAEVQRLAEEAKSKHRRGLPVVTNSETLGQFLQAWLDDSKRATVRASTLRSYEQIVRNHLVPGLGRVRLDKLTPQQVSAFLREKHEAGLSAAHIHRVLRAALNQALKWDKVARNAAALATVPKREAKGIAFLDERQALTFLNAVRGDRMEALFTVAMGCGLRLGEALGLRWTDVDLDRRELHVRQQLQRVKGKVSFVPPKTRNAARTLPLPGFVADALREHQARQDETRSAEGDRWQEHGLVFATSKGTPLDPRNVGRTKTRLLEKAELPDLRFHDLRHTCATLLIGQNVHPRVIMEQLGHGQIGLTMNTYSHVMPRVQREAADLMHGIFTKKSA